MVFRGFCFVSIVVVLSVIDSLAFGGGASCFWHLAFVVWDSRVALKGAQSKHRRGTNKVQHKHTHHNKETRTQTKRSVLSRRGSTEKPSQPLSLLLDWLIRETMHFSSLRESKNHLLPCQSPAISIASLHRHLHRHHPLPPRAPLPPEPAWLVRGLARGSASVGRRLSSPRSSS